MSVDNGIISKNKYKISEKFAMKILEYFQLILFYLFLFSSYGVKSMENSQGAEIKSTVSESSNLKAKYSKHIPPPGFPPLLEEIKVARKQKKKELEKEFNQLHILKRGQNLEDFLNPRKTESIDGQEKLEAKIETEDEREFGGERLDKRIQEFRKNGHEIATKLERKFADTSMFSEEFNRKLFGKQKEEKIHKELNASENISFDNKSSFRAAFMKGKEKVESEKMAEEKPQNEKQLNLKDILIEQENEKKDLEQKMAEQKMIEEFQKEPKNFKNILVGQKNKEKHSTQKMAESSLAGNRQKIANINAQTNLGSSTQNVPTHSKETGQSDRQSNIQSTPISTYSKSDQIQKERQEMKRQNDKIEREYARRQQMARSTSIVTPYPPNPPYPPMVNNEFGMHVFPMGIEHWAWPHQNVMPYYQPIVMPNYPPPPSAAVVPYYDPSFSRIATGEGLGHFAPQHTINSQQSPARFPKRKTGVNPQKKSSHFTRKHQASISGTSTDLPEKDVKRKNIQGKETMLKSKNKMDMKEFGKIEPELDTNLPEVRGGNEQKMALGDNFGEKIKSAENKNNDDDEEEEIVYEPKQNGKFDEEEEIVYETNQKVKFDEDKEIKPLIAQNDKLNEEDEEIIVYNP